MKNYLFIMCASPYQGNYVQEMLDVILTITAFEQKVSLLFLDRGVFQLKAGQNPDVLGLKDTTAILKALDVYDIKNIYIEVESLQIWNLKLDDLFLSAKIIYRKDVNRLLHTSNIIMSC